jgi:KUP system potassium uptake protein
MQRRGTERIGRLFGPIMVAWFVSMGLLGLRSIIHTPEILEAVNPQYALKVLLGHPGVALAILGAVFLVMTGGEALYIDMGHFGRKPVRIAWFLVVWPGLLLNYFGQGALLLRSPATTVNPFFELASPSALPFLVAIATAAAIIASQATISGAFSVTRQAVQLDLLPRVKILQTSADAHGQIYVPATNAFMFFATCAFVVIFQGSSALSGAYGAAVNGTMVITTVLGAIAARATLKWPTWRVIAVFGLFGIVDLAFVLGNTSKIPHGGWIPLVLATVMFAVFVTWHEGRAMLRAELRRSAVPLAELPALLEGATRVPGTAVFLVSHQGYVPTALLRNLEHNRVYHETIVILHLEIQRTTCGSRSPAPRARACASTRTARSSSAGISSAPARDAGSRDSRCGCSRGCSGAARRRRSSSACRPNAWSSSRPRSRSSRRSGAPRPRNGRSPGARSAASRGSSPARSCA